MPCPPTGLFFSFLNNFIYLCHLPGSLMLRSVGTKRGSPPCKLIFLCTAWSLVDRLREEGQGMGSERSFWLSGFALLKPVLVKSVCYYLLLFTQAVLVPERLGEVTAGTQAKVAWGDPAILFSPCSPHFQDDWSLSPLRNSSPSRIPRLIRSPVGAAVAVADKEPFGSGSAPLCLCQNSLGTLFKRNKKKSPLPPSSSGVFDSARAGWGEQGLSLCALNELP